MYGICKGRNVYIWDAMVVRQSIRNRQKFPNAEPATYNGYMNIMETLVIKAKSIAGSWLGISRSACGGRAPAPPSAEPVARYFCRSVGG